MRDEKFFNTVLTVAAGLAFFGGGGLVAVLLTEHTARWWLPIFWLAVISTTIGLTTLLLILVYSLSDPILRAKRPKVGPVLLANLGMALLVVAIIWHFSAPTKSTTNESHRSSSIPEGKPDITLRLIYPD